MNSLRDLGINFGEDVDLIINDFVMDFERIKWRKIMDKSIKLIKNGGCEYYILMDDLDNKGNERLIEIFEEVLVSELRNNLFNNYNQYEKGDFIINEIINKSELYNIKITDLYDREVLIEAYADYRM